METKGFEMKRKGIIETKASSEEYLSQNSKLIGRYSQMKVSTAEKKTRSEECLNQNSTFIGEYSEIKVIPADSECTLQASPSALANHSNTMSGENESIPLYQNIDKVHTVKRKE